MVPKWINDLKMKLQKHTTKVDDAEYSKWVVVIPPSQIKMLGWEKGFELESEVMGDILVLKRMLSPKNPKKMTYEEFKEVIREELEKEPKGLTWTQIKQRRPELYQRVPNNLWVRLMERDIGLIRQKKGVKTIWRLK